MNADRIYHILVVDDQKNWQRALKDLLEGDLGCKVSIAETFEKAKEMIRQNFDLAVLDVRLIDEQVFNVQGLALLRQIESEFPTTKSIVITGYPKSIPDDLNAHVIFKMPKDLNFDKLLKDKVTELLGK